jgi:alpha-L-arabinofuranosidase
MHLFVGVEPKGGNHFVTVTDRRTKNDFVKFIVDLVNKKYKTAKHIHVVLDNLNTHFKKSFDNVIGIKKSNQLFKKITFHHTAKHASWLNMAEIEIGIFDRQCLYR